MIKQIEDLGAKLDLPRLSNLEVLLQDEIEINQFGSTDISNAGVSKTVRRGLAGRE